MQDWSATQYLKFEDDRTRPVYDLIHAIPLKEVEKIVDLGCGPGNSTEALAKSWPQAEVSGFDASADMIKKAKARLPSIKFEVKDIYHWQHQPTLICYFPMLFFNGCPIISKS